MSNRPLLIVEDSDEDYEVTAWALRRAGIERPFLRCCRAEAALAELLPPPGAAPVPKPCLVLLDLNLPGTDGRQLLELLSRADNRPEVPIVVLSTSNNPADVRMCYRLGAAGYICKPLSLDVFVERMAALARYWFQAAVLPDPAG
jgi:DNA-binding response OmpR family regulator